jgi:hypothetical protein
MRSSNFGSTIIGEATTKAVDEVARQLDEKSAVIPVTVLQISGLVADAAPDGTIIVNVGSRAGLKVGDTLAIKRKVREVRDPATGKVLRSIEDSIGTITIMQVDETSATGKFSGTSEAKVGDTVSNAK